MKITTWTRTRTPEHSRRHRTTVARKLGRPLDTHWLYGILVPSELYTRIYKHVMAAHYKNGIEGARALVRKELLAAGHHFIYVRKSTLLTAKKAKEPEPTLFDRRVYAKASF